VGNDGETLVADSSAAVGLRYSATPSASNPILNSAFQIWQRGTSIAQAGGFSYSADRWVSARNGFDVGTTMSRQLTGDTTNLPFIQYCGRVQRNSGTTATTGVFFSQSIESINSIPFMGKTITFSFYARAGANYSSASNALSVKVDTGTGTDQSIINTWTGGASAIGGNQTATLTTTWQRFTYTGTASASGTQLGVQFSYTPVGTAGANDWFEVTGVQIDIGSVALPFRTYAATIQGELAACQRYYIRTSVTTGTTVFPYFGQVLSASRADFIGTSFASMRVKPTSIDFSNLRIQDAANSQFAFTSLVMDFGNENSWSFNGTLSGATSGRSCRIITDNSSNPSFLGFSAEL
jgi:hypothetical protein